MLFNKSKMPPAADALKGRADKMPVPPKHHVLDATIDGPYPAGTEKAMFGLGCFWGAEKKFWQLPGVYTTAVGYAAGMTPNPTLSATTELLGSTLIGPMSAHWMLSAARPPTNAWALAAQS